MGYLLFLYILQLWRWRKEEKEDYIMFVSFSGLYWMCWPYIQSCHFCLLKTRSILSGLLLVDITIIIESHRHRDSAFPSLPHDTWQHQTYYKQLSLSTIWVMTCRWIRRRQFSKERKKNDRIVATFSTSKKRYFLGCKGCLELSWYITKISS